MSYEDNQRCHSSRGVAFRSPYQHPTSRYSAQGTPLPDLHLLPLSSRLIQACGSSPELGCNSALSQGERENGKIASPDPRCSRSFWLQAVFSLSRYLQQRLFSPRRCGHCPQRPRTAPLNEGAASTRRNPGRACMGHTVAPGSHRAPAAASPLAGAWRPALPPGQASSTGGPALSERARPATASRERPPPRPARPRPSRRVPAATRSAAGRASHPAPGHPPPPRLAPPPRAAFYSIVYYFPRGGGGVAALTNRKRHCPDERRAAANARRGRAPAVTRGSRA